MTKNNNKGGGGIAAAAGIAALAAAAAGAYYFYHGKEGAKHRKQFKSWSVKAKGEVMEKMEKMKEMSKGAYDKAVNEVMDKYKRVKTIDPKELADLGMELKGHWDRISKQLTSPAPKRKPARAKSKR